MSAGIGYFAIALGFAACVLGIATTGAGLHLQRPELVLLSRRFAFGALGAAFLACVAMQYALFTHDFSIQFVADNVARATPKLYTFTAMWGALEGSILLWTLILCGYLVFVVRRFKDRATEPMVAWATLTGFAITLFFYTLMLLPANPFAPIEGPVPLDGNGPNPLLQNHILMAFHPPILYAGYVGMTVPFCFAIGALVTGRFTPGWLHDVRRSTLFAWGCLTFGIVLGGWWSYEVLGWGGYWGWDPVENASFMPWLTATAFLHSFMVQERRGLLRVWNLSLVIATFSLTILGTFLTRSGIIDSVHAFSESHIGPWLLALFFASIALGLGLIAVRGDALRAPGRIDSPISREGAFLANNLLFTGFALVVLCGTVFPLLAEALNDEPLSVGAPYFERMGTPLGIGLLFLMAVAPSLPWRAASGELLRSRLMVPAYVGVGTMALLVLFGARGVAPVISFGLGAFCIAGIVRNYAVAVAARRRARDEATAQAMWRQLRGNTRMYGGLTVHIGIVFIAVALGASSYTTSEQVRLAQGESAVVAGHTFTYVGLRTDDSPQKRTISADIRIERGSRDLGTYAPAISSFPNMPGGIGTPSVRTGLVRDIYLTLASTPTEQDRITLGVAINPLVLWIWIGGIVIALGTAIALIPPKREPVRVADTAREEVLVG